MNNTYYLNNKCSRWVTYVNGSKERITLQTKSGKTVTRTVSFWEAFGNYAVANISYHGKKIRVFADEVLTD